MHRLKRQFGGATVKTLLRCPTVVQDFAQLREAGVRIRRYRGYRNAAYSMRRRNAMYISKLSSIGGVITAIAHEKVHLIDSPTDPPVPGVTGRNEFIERCLNDELNAIEHEAVAVGELLRIGYRYISPHQREIHQLAQQGRAALRAWLDTAQTSTNGWTNAQHYGAWYDAAVKPHLWLP